MRVVEGHVHFGVAHHRLHYRRIFLFVHQESGNAARLSQESAAARDMIDRYYERYGRRPVGVAADNTYGNGELLQSRS